ncbi:hypothetical protein B0A48_10400 [Cryoendolithus antarcticus]|uniref:Cation/H+ exchanger transmembrane domain-containing protein n=1 Tax=Cryoendolithus antarcticus TaxID=1507870 RepID=A0A1V8SX45_9PEZI|nr:hypothetical protein B0A48_10400 [Cryoendolithus antarcticus]
MSTVTEFVSVTLTKTLAASASASATIRAAPQGGILEGSNPSHYDSKNPIILFIIQAGIIILFCRLLHYPLSLIRQPRVIAEVIGGILLGPSVMGRIPGFTNAIFPTASLPNLNLVANLGLVLFLFLVGLEVDLRYLVSNWRPAVSVGALGMALPFGLGCAIAYGLFNEFKDEPGTVPISFGTYMLFIGVAMAITAFPVLCRILTELKLLSTPVGVIVLSAGVSNDVVGWVLLALCVALVNAGSGLTALWVLLTCVGYVFFLVFAVRPAFIWFLRRNHALTDGPSQGIIVLTLLIALGSAFFTGVIGVHPIFGAFLAGLICPHEGGFAIKVTEKIEDLVTALFLPLYFALSGLSTNLGLLDTGITWAYVIGVTATAFVAKFTGGSLAARLNGMVWRESFTIGALMSCKGLVELIVLNIGLSAKILSTRTFTIFVVMALITTFATTPLTAALYPPWYQRKLEAWKRGEIDWATGKPIDGSDSDSANVIARLESTKVKSVLVYLRLDNMPTLLAFVSLLGGKQVASTTKLHPSLEKATQGESERSKSTEINRNKKPTQVHGVRFVELDERGSSVMKVSEVDEYTAFDPVLNAFRVLGQLYNLAVSGEVTVSPIASYSDILIHKAADEASDLLLLPWSETGSMVEAQTISNESVQNKLASTAYTQFVARTLDQAVTTTAVFINKGFSGTLKPRPSTLSRSMSNISMRRHSDYPTQPALDRSHHIYMPFFGGGDSRAALRLVLQIAENPEVTATIVHFTTSARVSESGSGSDNITERFSLHGNAKEAQDPAHADHTYFSTVQKSLAPELAQRVVFDSIAGNSPLLAALGRIQEEVGQNPRNGGDLIVLGRGKTDMSGSAFGTACLGGAAGRLLDAGVKASLLVVQARE